MTFPRTEGGVRGGVAHNMSAPPRSTVSFRPYGARAGKATKTGVMPASAGLRHLLRADPDVLLAACLPDTARRLRAWQREWLAAASGQNPAAASAHSTRLCALRLAGLVALAASLAVGAPAAVVADLAEEPLEALQDRLADLAGRLPSSPALPAMAVAESLAGDASRGGPGTTDALAVLWALTHLNGRTFDRHGPPILAPDLAAGGAWDLFAP